MKEFPKLGRNCVVIFLVLAGAVIATGATGCTSAIQDAQRTPIGSVVSGKTDTTSDYLDEVTRQNQGRAPQSSSFQGGGAPVRPGSGGY